MNNFLSNKIYSLKDKKIKSLSKYILPIIFGVLYKLNTITLFIGPIIAIKSISAGSLSPTIKNLLNYFYLPTPNEEYLFLYFFSSISMALISLLIVSELKKFYIFKIKNKILKKFKKEYSILTKKNFILIQEKYNKVDKLVKNSENIVFCSILVLMIIFYDFGIALILLTGGFTYFKYLKNRANKHNKKVNMLQSGIESNKKNLINRFNDLIIQNPLEKSTSKSIIATIIMLLIMTFIYLRTDSTISIVFIFLVRIYQSQMLKTIQIFIKRIER